MNRGANPNSKAKEGRPDSLRDPIMKLDMPIYLNPTSNSFFKENKVGGNQIPFVVRSFLDGVIHI